ncbi:MAG: dual specificity protein phosphatase family protein, partial [Promethearchaeota archaeon]
MRNFRWQIKGVLAGANEPSGHRDTSFIVEKGIRVLVTLTEDPLAREDIAFLESQGVSYHHSPVLDGQAPTLRQLKWFVELVKESRAKEFPVLVHCRAGCGRAGTFISAYLIFTEGCSVKTAIRKVRRLFRSYYRLVCRGEPTQPQIAQLQEFAKQLKQGRATNHSARLKKQKLYQLVGGFALHNFSYLIPGVLAGSNLPYERSDLKWLFDKGIRVLVTAMDESLDEATVTSVGLTYYYYYVPPYGTPTLEQLQ